MKSTLLVFALLLMFAPGVPLRAQQVLSYFTQVQASPSNWTRTLQLPAFDENLGTLTQVKLSYAGEVWQSLYAENLGEDCVPFTLSSTAKLSLTKPNGPELITLDPVKFIRSGRLGHFDGATDFARGSGVTFSQHLVLRGIYVDANLGDYLRGGVIDFSAVARASSKMSSGGNVIGGATNSATASLAIEYTYAPIPEPAVSAGLLGLIGLLATIWRRQRYASAS